MHLTGDRLRTPRTQHQTRSTLGRTDQTRHSFRERRNEDHDADGAHKIFYYDQRGYQLNHCDAAKVEPNEDEVEVGEEGRVD